ncbi:hypothetical protein AVEN_252355-1 [Araneus ventricosus]|uniref:RNase H type-1 domain-containing protein n=1 Tax=Araneus ventricosus TaxID=182803 RepID=A0A4Y2ASB9_ARAVE|nr:hypothetical protein AVEN_252355-1 [Araneus ventricosus]
MTRTAPELAPPLGASTSHQRENVRLTRSYLTCIKPTYTTDLQYNWVSNLQPFSPEAVNLPRSPHDLKTVGYLSMPSRATGRNPNSLIGLKEKFRLAGRLVGLSWVKVHVGIPGNELADRFAKQASTDGEIMNIPFPYS